MKPIKYPARCFKPVLKSDGKPLTWGEVDEGNKDSIIECLGENIAGLSIALKERFTNEKP